MTTKDLAKRVADACELRAKLEMFLAQGEIKVGDIESLRPFLDDCNAFVREGRSISGSVKCPELKRVLRYRLSIQPHVASSLDILFRPALFKG